MDKRYQTHYRILPNKGAGRINKVTSDVVSRKLGSKLSSGGFGLKVG